RSHRNAARHDRRLRGDGYAGNRTRCAVLFSRGIHSTLGACRLHADAVGGAAFRAMGFVLEEKCSVRLNNSETIPELWFLVPLEMSMNTNLKGDCWLNRKSSHRPAVTTLVIPLVLLCFGLSPKMQAVIPA